MTDTESLITELHEMWTALHLPSALPVDHNLLKRFILAKYTEQNGLAVVLKCLKNYIGLINDLRFDEHEWDEIVGCLDWCWTPNPILRDHKGRALVFIKMHEYYPSSYGFKVVGIVHVLLIELFILSSEDMFDETVKGVHIVIDFSGLGWTNWNIKIQKRLATVMQSGPPIKLKKVQIVDAPWIFGAIWKIAKTWVTDKMRNRIKFVNKRQLLENLGDLAADLDTVYGGEQDWSEFREEMNDRLMDMFTGMKRRIIEHKLVEVEDNISEKQGDQ